MRRALFVSMVVALLLAAGAGFVASPFVAAWSLREAVRNSDTQTIARKVEFIGVRASLRQSLGEHAELYGFATEAGRAVKPSIWQRVKSAFGANMIDRFIETYISAEGLPKLFKAKIAWNENVRGQPSPDALPWGERIKAYLARVKRAEFRSFTQVEIEMADEHNPDRHFVSSLELQGFEWRLVALRVVKPAALTMPANRLIAGN